MTPETIEWRSVDEAMPEPYAPLLVQRADGVVIAGFVDRLGGWRADGGYPDPSSLVVRAWAPLPKGPQ